MWSMRVEVVLFAVFSCAGGLQRPMDAMKLGSAKEYLQEMSENAEKWINPYDMLSNEHLPGEHELISIAPKSDAPVDTVSPSGSYRHLGFRGNGCFTSDFVFLKRWLKIFLGTVDYNSFQSADAPKVVTFSVTRERVEKMKKVVDSDVPNMQDVEALLSDLVAGYTVSHSSWLVYDLVNTFHRNEVFTVFVFAALLLSTLYVFQKFMSVRFFVISIGVVSILFHWMRLYKRAVAERTARLEQAHISESCRRSKSLGILDSLQVYIKSYFTDPGECVKYYEAIMVDPFWDVSPTTAIADTFSVFIFKPLEIFCQVLNKCVKELFSELTAFNSFVMLLLVFFIPLLFLRYRFRLPFFMGSFEPVRSFTELSFCKKFTDSAVQVTFETNACAYNDPRVLCLHGVSTVTPCVHHTCMDCGFVSKQLPVVSQNSPAVNEHILHEADEAPAECSRKPDCTEANVYACK